MEDPLVATEAFQKAEDAMNLLYCMVKGRQTDNVANNKIVEWLKCMKDEVRTAVKEDKQHEKERKKAAKELKRNPSTKIQGYLKNNEVKKLRSEMLEYRKKAKAERRLEKAVANLWSLKPSSTASPLPATSASSVLDFADQFDEAVTGRDTNELQVDDIYFVEQLGQLLSSATIFGNGLDDNLLVDEVPGVMTRYHLFSGKSITIRLHLFHALAETYVHNHKNNFSSMCLYGNYEHRQWLCDSDPNSGHHYQFTRKGDGSLSEPEKKSGKLFVSNSSTHDMNKVYFINKETYHTVIEQSTEKHLKGTLTLYVKGQDSDHITKVLCKDPYFKDNGPQEAEFILEGERKQKALQQMSAMLRMSAADIIRRTGN